MQNMWNQASFSRASGGEICLIYGINKNDGLRLICILFASVGVKDKEFFFVVLFSLFLLVLPSSFQISLTDPNVKGMSVYAGPCPPLCLGLPNYEGKMAVAHSVWAAGRTYRLQNSESRCVLTLSRTL